MQFSNVALFSQAISGCPRSLASGPTLHLFFARFKRFTCPAFRMRVFPSPPRRFQVPSTCFHLVLGSSRAPSACACSSELGACDGQVCGDGWGAWRVGTSTKC
eukprot:scaffold1758_cov333-Pavlova_lutheri.AAC.17